MTSPVSELSDLSVVKLVSISTIYNRLGHMATECTEFWKIKGNLQNKKQNFKELEEKVDEKPKYIRRLSRHSFRLGDNQILNFQNQIHHVKQVHQTIESPKKSYEVKNQIVEESEDDDSASSYNIFDGNSSSSDESSKKNNPKIIRSQLIAPNIDIKRFSSKKIKTISNSSSANHSSNPNQKLTERKSSKKLAKNSGKESSQKSSSHKSSKESKKSKKLKSSKSSSDSSKSMSNSSSSSESSNSSSDDPNKPLNENLNVKVYILYI